MKSLVKTLYRIYQLCIALPIIAVSTLLTALTVIVGCTFGNGHFWGYYPGKWWAWIIVRVLLLPVKVEGRENLAKGQSYVFVANHQGAFDIFLIYGFLGRNFKWMMKRQLRNMPFVGKACEAAHHIFVESAVRARYARPTIALVPRSATVCRSWCFLKVHVRSRDTWAPSSVARSCLPTSCSCPLFRSPSTARSM